MYRPPNAAPVSSVAEDLRGSRVGRFCRACGGIYPLYRDQHSGKSLNGRDHVSPPCAHEGDHFDEDEGWWEDAVKVLKPKQDDSP